MEVISYLPLKLILVYTTQNIKRISSFRHFYNKYFILLFYA